MRSLEWSTSHAVFVAEIDDEHKEIFDSVSNLQLALSSQNPASETSKLTQRLVVRIEGHFAHEERLMRAARYASFRWHKQNHDSARKRVQQFVSRMAQGDTEAGPALVEYLTSWLHNHTRLADLMLGTFLRNHQRGLYKITLRAGTKPIGSCTWVDSKGEQFDPATGTTGY
jgi:hemerythrin